MRSYDEAKAAERNPLLEEVARILTERQIRRRGHWQHGDERLIRIAVGQSWRSTYDDLSTAFAQASAALTPLAGEQND